MDARCPATLLLAAAAVLLAGCLDREKRPTEPDVEICPGEGDRYGDHKCNHDSTHRVCAQLLDANGEPQRWGQGDFWEITGQKSFQWDDKIRANGGDSWCICMWATADLIDSAGCENVHIRCEATDVAFVMASYSDGGRDLTAAKECLQHKCRDGPAPAATGGSQRAGGSGR